MPKQIVADTFEALGGVAKDTASGIAREPLNIIKDLLGQDIGSDEQAPSISGGQQQAQQKAQTNQTQALQQLQKSDELQKAEKIAKIRQQMQYLQKQKAESDRLKSEADEEDEEKLAEEQQKQQEEVVQLSKERDKESVLQGNIKALEGTKESGPRKQFWYETLQYVVKKGWRLCSYQR